MFKKVIYNTASQIVGKFTTATSSLIITILIGRTLGPAGYGDFTKIFTFVGYFYTFADFGFNAIYIKQETKSETGNLIRYLFGLRLLISISLAIAAMLISLALPYNSALGLGFSPLVKVGIAIASLTIITQALFTTANAVFQKNLRYDLSTIASVIGTFLILALTILAVLEKSPIFFYVAAYVFGGITFVTIAYFLILKKFNLSILPLFSKTVFQKLLSAAWPIGMALIFNLIYFRVDVLILSYTWPSQEVGLYGIAYQFFEVALAVPIFFANALYPLLSNLYIQSQSEYQKQTKLWTLILFVFSLALSLALMVAAEIIPILLGSRFAPSKTALIILALGMPFFFISALFWHMIIIHNKQKTLIAIYGLGAIFNITSNLIFIPKYGFLAAAITTVASEALVLLLLALVLKSPFGRGIPSPVAPNTLE